MNGLLTPLGRALGQMDDPVFRGVLLQSVLWALACFVVLVAGAVWAIDHLLEGWLGGWWSVGADVLGGIAAALLAFWLFLPVAAAIGTLFLERVARAVERRWYPALPPGQGASFPAQMWDGVAVGVRILLLNLLALVFALFIPGLGLLLAWAIGAYAIGRGLFVAVAMRRMGRAEAEALFRRQRVPILAQGGVMALAGYLPLLNLLIPVVGTAAMVHVLDRALVSASRSPPV